MGVDAEMLVRYRGPRPDDDQLTRWSWDLCRSIGAKHFFIDDGLPSPAYHVADRNWHEAFNAHPRYGAWKSSMDHGRDEEKRSIHDQIFRDIGQPPKQLRRAIELTNTVYPLGDDDTGIPNPYRVPGKTWIQDGDPIFADEGETFLEVNLWTRYYGPDYERGDLLVICATAEWCEQNLHPCEVWYGGDSSGIVATPFPAAERERLRRHLYGPEGRDYFSHREEPGSFKTPPPCGLCVKGENRFDRYGWGNSYIAVHCQGCGKSFESRDLAQSWQEKKDD